MATVTPRKASPAAGFPGEVPAPGASKEVILLEGLQAAALEAAKVGLEFGGLRRVLPVGPRVRGVGVVLEVGPALVAGTPAVLILENGLLEFAARLAGGAPEHVIGV